MSGLRLSKALVFVVLVVGGFWGWKQLSRSGSPDAQSGSNKGEVARGDIVQRVTMIGTVKAEKTLVVRAPYKGFVRKIFVKVGEVVKIGSPLVSIAQSADQPDSEIFPIRSTMSGIVTQIQTDVGEAVSESVTDDSYILRVDDLGHYSVACDTPEIDVIKLKVGQKAVVRASAINDRQFTGQISTISLASSFQDRWNRGVVQFKVEVGIEETKIDLRPGMTAMVDVITAELKGVLSLRHEFVDTEGGKYFVTLEDGQRIEVKVGLQDETSFEILDGLKEGQKVRQVDFVAASKRSRGTQ